MNYLGLGLLAGGIVGLFDLRIAMVIFGITGLLLVIGVI